MVATFIPGGNGLGEIVDSAIARDVNASDWSSLARQIRPSAKSMDGDPLTRLFSTEFGIRAHKRIVNEEETLGEVGTYAANVLARALQLDAVQESARSKTIVVYHGADRSRRSLLILDPTLHPETPVRVEHAESWGSALRANRELTLEPHSLDALWIARPRVVIAPAPELEYTCVRLPPGFVQYGSKPSTAGAYARDASGATGVTICHHGTGGLGTAITIDGINRSVDAASPILDTCFVCVPEAELPPATSMKARGGLLTARAPGAQEQHTFWSAGARKKAAVIGVDLGVPFHTRSRQLCVYTDPVTNYGDSGGALVNDYDELVGFAFQRTPFGTPVQFATWIWARSAFEELGLTVY